MDKKDKIVKGVVIGVLAVVMLFSAWKIIEIVGGYQKSQSVYSSAAEGYLTVQATPDRTIPNDRQDKKEEDKEEEEDDIRDDLKQLDEAENIPVSVDFESMTKDYPDVVGWILLSGTKINYPVLCGTEDNYYIDHLYDGESSSNGSIFMDRRNETDFTDKNTILYGHHMKDGSMFAALDGYREQKFANEHSTIWLMTPEKTYRLKPFSAYVTNSTSGAYDVGFATNSSLLDWCKDRMLNSGVEFKTIPLNGDKVVTLSTCSYEYDEARFVVHCVVEDAE